MIYGYARRGMEVVGRCGARRIPIMGSLDRAELGARDAV